MTDTPSADLLSLHDIALGICGVDREDSLLELEAFVRTQAIEQAARIAETAQGPHRETVGSKSLRSAIVAAIRRAK